MLVWIELKDIIGKKSDTEWYHMPSFSLAYLEANFKKPQHEARMLPIIEGWGGEIEFGCKKIHMEISVSLGIVTKKSTNKGINNGSWE